MDVDAVFRARSRTVFDFLTRDVHGCRIPAYQRPYAWDGHNVDRLLEDASSGLHNLATDGSTLRFLGSVITINAGPPEYRDRPQVRELIDGQQRLCTVAVFNVLMHAKLTKLARELAAVTAAATLCQELRDFARALSTTYSFEPFGEPDLYRIYPRITRELEDQWGRCAADVKYNSPISRLIWEYIKHTHGADREQEFAYSAVNERDEPLLEHEPLIGVIDHLNSVLEQLSIGCHKDLQLPDVERLRTGETFVRQLWVYPPAEELMPLLSGNDSDEALNVAKAVRLSAIARFVNHRMVATIIEAAGEDYAFDLFEALNTTGQPLTAFETFVPKVVEREKPSYRTSPSRQHLDRVQAYLDRFDKADDRQLATSTLLIPFALSENGHKLEKHLSKQRRYLRERYAAATEETAGRAFVRNMAETATFVGRAWRPPPGSEPQLLGDPKHRDHVAEFCFEALRDTRHEVTLAPLLRFHAAFEEATGTAGRKAAAKDFFEAVKAIAAFSMIWRASKGNTANIDGVYRDLMQKGIGGVPPLCRTPAGKAAAEPSIANLRRALQKQLQIEGINRNTWTRDVSHAAIYKVGQGVTRFLLMAAVHNTILVNRKAGFYTKGKAQVLPLLTRDAWRDDRYLSVEHVAPSSRESDGWPADVYEDPRTVHQLGNFVLMPMIENRMLGNRTWAHKKLLYKVFGTRTSAAANRALKQAREEGFTPSKKLLEHLAGDASYLHMCASIMSFRGEWSARFIEERSEHLAELAWDQISPWIFATTSPMAEARESTASKKNPPRR